MIQINLLPWREQARQEKKLQFMIILAACIVATIFFIFIYHFYINSLIRHQQKRNDYLQSQIVIEQAALTQLNQEKQEQATVEAQLHFIFGLRESSYQAVRLFDELVRVVPDAVTLNKIMRQGDSITIFGKAESDLQITLFMKSIEKSVFFKQPILTEISTKQKISGDEKYFQLKVSSENGLIK